VNGDDERDYDEEAAVRRDVEREGLAEQAAERAEQVAMERAAEQQDEHAREVAGHLSGPGHFLAAERLLRAAEDGGLDETMLDQDEYLFAAQVHATLALAAATAANIRRNGALAEVGVRLDETHKSEGLVEKWFEVLG